MRKRTSALGFVAGLAVGLALAPAGSARVLDDFNDNTKTAWSDFTFVPGFGLPQETGGQMRFDMPPAGQDIFTATQKTSELFELKEGRTLEFRVDLAASAGEDSYAVLAFIPSTGAGPGTLGGYGLAKDPTDVLITKGIQKYFVADDGVTAELKNENVTLVLSLTAKGGNVIITGQVLDKDANDAVLWQRTVVDTPAADLMEDGTDSNPSTPYLTTGYFTLYCYQQFNTAIGEYSVTYDNAEVYVLDEEVLDDFNDNTKTNWTDFTFVPGFGLPQETGGQFKFDLPAAGQDIFSASQKTSRLIELKEGERHEFRVDLMESGGEDSYAVLAFIPNTGGGPGTLGGYGLAKDPTDVLITKGIQKYFVADDGVTAELKNERVTLALTLTVKGGNVIITGKVLDLDADNAVLWERTVVDTPAADLMEDGTDSNPSTPYITTGFFTLYCYQQFNTAIGAYSVSYDNAVLVAPPAAANTAPLISDVQPEDYANFLPTTTQVVFKVTDDKPLVNEKISVVLNGTTYTTANGLSITGSGSTRTVTLGGLVANTDYAAVLQAEDAEGLSSSRRLYFDTFATSNRMIEIEDYNFGMGVFVNDPVPVAEGGYEDNGYSLQTGEPEVDFHETRATPNGGDTMYRPSDPVRMQRSRDLERAKYTAAGGKDAGVYDYDVIDIAAGEWLNYTRQIPAGTYEVYLRQGLANMTTGESVLERVTSDPAQPDQQTQAIGSFLGSLTGFQYRNFPLTDGTGSKKAILRVTGTAPTTLRLRQVTADPADGARFQSYLILVPVPDPGLETATVASVQPANGAVEQSVAPEIVVVIQNRETSVNTSTVKLEFNGQPVAATVTPDATGATVRWMVAPLPASGAQNTAKISFKDSAGTEIAQTWAFTVEYLALNAANRQPGPGKDRGFLVRVVQTTLESMPLENTLDRAERQLAANSLIPIYMETHGVEQLINMSQEGGAAGVFVEPDYPEIVVPGIDLNYSTDDFSVEAKAWLELNAGAYRLVVISDDGFKVSSGNGLNARDPIIGFHNGGPADESTGRFDFVVPVTGFYPFRLVWYERGGGAHAEWFAVNLATGERILINDAKKSAAIKAYQDVEAAPAVTVQSAVTVSGPYADEPGAVVDVNTKTVTLATSGNIRFYRLEAASALQIKTVRIQGANLVLTYE